MGLAEVAEPPGGGGEDSHAPDEGVAVTRPGKEVQGIRVDSLNAVNRGADAACLDYCDDWHGYERGEHE